MRVQTSVLVAPIVFMAISASAQTSSSQPEATVAPTQATVAPTQPASTAPAVPSGDVRVEAR